MLSTVDLIREKLGTLSPLSLQIDDESAQHAGHAGARDGGGHYRVSIVSAQFAGQSLPARHRMIYGALGPLMRKEIHMLAIDARAPDEIRKSTHEERQ